ncbi:hypothetical protein AVEN_152344-1 [Araneus ventricosus]|uniref:Uncharacterized protein n=1 Tax=Araneus ventricosus TaxID=182803 RepID=A0A4Y2FXD9_ARAVE|nr:hypothetical protein AVEN_152344-1 [Araneus ventricosus]
MNNKLHFVKPFIDRWPVLPIRELDVKLTRLRIGHARFTHKHLIFGERTPVCPTCHTDFTINHILIECPSFKSHLMESRFPAIKSLPSNAGLMVGKRVLQGEAWSDLSDSRGTHDLGDLGDK